MASFFDEIAANNMKSLLLMGAFVILFSLMIYFGVVFIFGGGGIGSFIFGFILVLIYAFIVWFFGHKAILALSGAQVADQKQYPQLYEMVDGLAQAAQVPTPKIYIVNDPTPNAFSTGPDRKHSIICVNTGLLKIMDKRSLEGVISHEMSHIYDNDIKFMMIAVVFAGVIGLIAAIIRNTIFWGGGRNRNGYLIIIGLVVGILAPLFATLINLAISRRREYMADANGARMIRDPAALAGALQKIKDFQTNPQATPAHVNEMTAPLYFANPFSAKSIMNIFSTHPPLDDRIAKLKAMY